MWSGFVLFIFAGAIGFNILTRKRISPSDVRLRLSREEDLRVLIEKDGGIIIRGKYIRCKYIRNGNGTDQLVFKAAGRKGKLTVDYNADGELVIWDDEASIYGGYSFRYGRWIDKDIWLFESVRGTIMNAIETAPIDGAHPHV